MDARKSGRARYLKLRLGFWIVKIIATTLGETAGDAVSMTMQLGYAVSSIIFIGIFLVAVSAQIAAKSFHPFLYWAVIVATTTAGTTMADFADRSLGIGYAGGAVNSIYAPHGVSFGVVPHRRLYLGHHITSPKVELFYWTTILFSQTLGHGTRRLGGRYQWAGIRRRSAGFRRRLGVGRCRLLLYK